MNRMNIRPVLALTVLALLTLAGCSGGDDADRIRRKIEKTETEIAALQRQLMEQKEALRALGGDTVEEVVNFDLVTVETARDTVFRHFIEVQGVTNTDDNVMVTTDVGGIALSISAEEGRYYPKGTVLAQLDNSTILRSIDEIETQLDLATDVYEKQKRLWDQDIGSELQYLQAKNNKEALEKQLASARNQLSKTTVRAPITGFVDEIFVHQGEMLAPGAPAMRMVNLDRMTVEADVPENYLPSVKTGEEVELHFPALGETRPATITSLGQFINPANRTFKVYVDVANPDGMLKPNMLAEIRINDYTNPNALTIPSRILQQSVDGYFIFLAVEDSSATGHRAERRIIEIGTSYEGATEVTTGLSEGEMVIDEGYRDVRSGGVIRIDNL